MHNNRTRSERYFSLLSPTNFFFVRRRPDDEIRLLIIESNGEKITSFFQYEKSNFGNFLLNSVYKELKAFPNKNINPWHFFSRARQRQWGMQDALIRVDTPTEDSVTVGFQLSFFLARRTVGFGVAVLV